MKDLSIGKSVIQIKEFQNQRVVTFRDIDLVHDRKSGTAKRNFINNKGHFIQGVDFYKVTRNDVGESFTLTYGFDKKAPAGALLTESGYLMLVKSFTDDLAWSVQRELVNNYFHVKHTAQPMERAMLKKSRWGGVLTGKDLAVIFGVPKTCIADYSEHLKPGEGYVLLKKRELADFKAMNPGAIQKNVPSLWVFTKSGIYKLAEQFGRSTDYLDMLFEQYQKEEGQTSEPKPIDMQRRYSDILMAQMLVDAADKITDPYCREFAYQNAVNLLTEGGLWEDTGTEFDERTKEGYNKRALLFNAGLLMRKGEPITREKLDVLGN